MYLIDTNVLVESHTQYYSYEGCPAFWAWLDEMTATGMIATIEKVREELRNGSWLEEWSRSHPQFFLPMDKEATDGLRDVTKWVQDSTFKPAQRAAFLEGADPMLIGYARGHSLTLVTIEVAARDRRNPNKIKIPDLCNALEVRCITPWQLLKYEGANFVLGPGRGRQPQHDPVTRPPGGSRMKP